MKVTRYNGYVIKSFPPMDGEPAYAICESRGIDSTARTQAKAVANVKRVLSTRSGVVLGTYRQKSRRMKNPTSSEVLIGVGVLGAVGVVAYLLATSRKPGNPLPAYSPSAAVPVTLSSLNTSYSVKYGASVVAKNPDGAAFTVAPTSSNSSVLKPQADGGFSATATGKALLAGTWTNSRGQSVSGVATVSVVA